MPIATRSKRVPNSLSATFDEATPLDSTYRIVAIIDRNSTTAPTQATLEAAGWTFKDSQVTAASTGVNVGMWVYHRLGNGSVNGITVDGTASGTTITLLAMPAYDLAGLTVVKGTTAQPTLGTDVDVALTYTSTEDSELAWSFVRAGNTAGGTGFAWTGSYATIAGGSSSSTGGYAEKNLPTSGGSGNTTVSWTTTGRPAAAMVIAAKTVDPTPPLPEGEWFLWLPAKDLNTPVDFLGVLEP